MTPDTPHTCECKHCGRVMEKPEQPKACLHVWRNYALWSDASGTHWTARCAKCGLYEQW